MKPSTELETEELSETAPSKNKESSPPKKKTSILDMSWLTSSEDDAFYRDLIVSASQKSSMKPPSLRKQVLNSSPTLERVSRVDFTGTSSASLILELSQARQENHSSKRVKYSPTGEFSDPISSSSAVSSPPPAPKVAKSKAKGTTKGNKPKESKTKNGFSDKDWRLANKLRRTRDEIFKEMIVEVALCLEELISTEHFKECFSNSAVRRTYLEIPLVSWKRKVTADYNAEEDVFVPCEPKEISERVLALYYEPQDLIDRIQNGSLEVHISTALRRAKIENPLLKHHLVILVPCFKEYLRKLQSAEDKRYREQMLLQMNMTTTRQLDEDDHPMSASEAQKLLIETEVSLGVNIFLTRSVEETIDWLTSFTFTIGNSLYDKHERNPEFANFGQTRLGSDRKSTFVEMMKKFNLMSKMKAEKLYEFYTSPASLFKRLSEKDNLGTVNGKTIVPPTVNSAIRRVFTSSDPNQVIND